MLRREREQYCTRVPTDNSVVRKLSFKETLKRKDHHRPQEAFELARSELAARVQKAISASDCFAVKPRVDQNVSGILFAGFV